MAKIAYILLCHKDPGAIIAQAKQLTAVGDCISIHFAARATTQAYQRIREALDPNPNVTFAKKRIRCGWGEWSLVQATLYAIEAATEAFRDATHFYMVSGDCMAIKSAEYAHRFLDTHDKDFIESFDYFESDWIKTGMKEDRLIYKFRLAANGGACAVVRLNGFSTLLNAVLMWCDSFLQLGFPMRRSFKPLCAMSYRLRRSKRGP